VIFKNGSLEPASPVTFNTSCLSLQDIVRGKTGDHQDIFTISCSDKHDVIESYRGNAGSRDHFKNHETPSKGVSFSS